NVQDIARIGHQEHILSTTSVPDYVRNGIEVGISQLAGKPRIIINLGSARAAGADFGAGLLRMATVIQGDSP
ncbi:MAG TPA: YfiR/HmsC family protein, partial [Bacteroidota bacterium]